MGIKTPEIQQSWFLESSLSDGNAVQIKINNDPFVVGRDKKCNLTLSSSTISRRHAEIFSKDSTFYLRDLGSTNGTFINSKKIAEEEIVHNGDYITFADLQFKLIYKGTEIRDKVRKSHTDTQTNFLKNPRKYHSFADAYKLSKREEEILFLLLQGKSTREIAETLFITFGTAKNHILSIFNKTDVHSKFQLLAIYNKLSGKKK
ncbi:MAG: FHA domain-containing protein [Spirochaetaceae bacterium]|nr:MAG: FHA domain-containing protein [Spirochaetaceae bacterium]